jgi:hypothetical protein
VVAARELLSCRWKKTEGESGGGGCVGGRHDGPIYTVRCFGSGTM